MSAAESYDNGNRRGLVNYGSSHPEDKHDWLELNKRLFDDQPEKLLMLAVLQDCIDVLTSHPLKPHKLETNRRREVSMARWWVRDTGTDYLFSFENCCTYLNLDSQSIRKKMLALKPPESS